MTSFILGTNEPVRKKNPYANSDRAWEEAKAARHAARARTKERTWQVACDQLARWTPTSAVEAMHRMPSGVQQMYALAEESNLNRIEVLRFFPAVGQSTREAWAEFATPPAPKKAAKPKQRKTDNGNQAQSRNTDD